MAEHREEILLIETRMLETRDINFAFSNDRFHKSEVEKQEVGLT